LNERELRVKPAWLQEIFPWPQQSVVVNGRTMAYVEAGPADGRPVLLLSGNPTWGFLYRDFLGPLAEAGYRAIAPDWVGCGYSDHPRIDSALTLAHHIADLVSFIDQLGLNGFVVVGQDWGGPQGLGAALQRRERMAGLVLMSTWAFTGNVGRFHSSPRPWTTWHAPLTGQFFMNRLKVLSQNGPSTISKRGMSGLEARAYHHVFDEPGSDHVVLTWPRTIPMREGDRGWEDMTQLQARLPEIGSAPALLLWGTEDSVFGKSYADRLKELIPHAEGPFPIEGADHFIQDDRGPEVAARIVEFVNRTLGSSLAGGAPAPRELKRTPRATDWSFALEAGPGIDETRIRADPLLFEQELDVRPEVAEAIEAATGIRSGRRYWTSAHGHRYALELADLGRGRPSMATVFGLWDRWEPRPQEDEIDQDLLDLSLWIASISPGIDPEDVRRVAGRFVVEAP
jgi:pimeloyl-ACP methyl ester carboxylesterase